MNRLVGALSIEQGSIGRRHHHRIYVVVLLLDAPVFLCPVLLPLLLLHKLLFLVLRVDTPSDEKDSETADASADPENPIHGLSLLAFREVCIFTPTVLVSRAEAVIAGSCGESFSTIVVVGALAQGSDVS